MYQSFLICFHPGHTDVYRNGLPLGVIRDGDFHVHKSRMPDGAEVPVDVPPELLNQVISTITSMQDATE